MGINLHGPLRVRDGAYGELIVALHSIDDAPLVEALSSKRSVQVFDEGATLLIALSIRTDIAPELKKHLVRRSDLRLATCDGVPADCAFVAVTVGPSLRRVSGEIRRGLWLLFDGFEATGIESGPIRVPPEVSGDPAISLNHAFTLLSEKYEAWRKAHTANIYTRAFYQEENSVWYPLDDLRQRELGSVERKVVADVWSGVGRQLGLLL